MRLVQEIRSHLQYKIIIPFLLLTLVVALAGSSVAFLFITGTAQERLNNQLAEVARTTSDDLVGTEAANLQFLREMAFAGPNQQSGAPAISAAVADAPHTGLEQALDPYYRVSVLRQGVRADRLIVFDVAGRSLVDWERQQHDGETTRASHPARDLTQLWFVPRILAGARDSQGDKFAGLLDLGNDTSYFFTVAPVTHNGQIVGGIVVATRLDTLLNNLRERSWAGVVTLYRADDGKAFAASQTPSEGLAFLDITPAQAATIRDTPAEQASVFNASRVNGRRYQFAYLPLRVRGDVVALLSVALSLDYVTGPWADAQVPLIGITIGLMLAIVGLGAWVARQITRPLRELVATAQSVTAGNLDQRSTITSNDEVGILSHSFNDMTEHLLHLYRVVQSDAQQRAAIVESISDGVMVCDLHGDAIIANRAMRGLLELNESQELPKRFENLPLRPIDDGVLTFGDNMHAYDLFWLGEKVVRVRVAPVLAEDDTRIGDVYVLQDMTSEAAVDRAKTNFIATISHELRTPLTVLGGSTDLLLRGLMGGLDDDQRMLIEGMRKHTQAMIMLLNNVITLAGIESGSLQLELEPLSLRETLNEVLWSQRAAIKLKGLELHTNIPDDLPDVLADMHQLRNVLQQLIDNARRYTAQGGITLSATQHEQMVQVNVSDTGQGVSDDLSEQLFTRFTRGSQGINSAERGIGLGLAIAKLLLERQGGTIWLEDTSEHGSTFSFTLPCAEAQHQPEKALVVAA